MSSQNNNRTSWKKKAVSSNNHNPSQTRPIRHQHKSKRNSNPNKGHQKHKVNKQNNTNHKLEAWMTENIEEQKNEFQSIKDIYSDEIIVIKAPTSYQLNVTNDKDESQHICLDIKYPIEYPSQHPPQYSISTSYLKQIPNRNEIESKFTHIWNENQGECIMFEWISEFKEFALNIFSNGTDRDTQRLIQKLLLSDDNAVRYCSIPIDQQRHRLCLCPDIIFCDEVIDDRKSVFKSFGARVRDIDQIKAFIDKLKSNKKIANATHNMIAYRLSSASSGIVNEHYDDDGEHGGAKVMLEILRKRSLVDVVVMVTRWYGGKHLGPDRFKHIKNMTQYVVEQGQWTANAKYEDKYKQMKPSHKEMEQSKNICNRLYWSTEKHLERKHLYIGCKCKDKKLNHVMEFNVEEYGVQKNGIEWVEYLSYKRFLIWDIFDLRRSFQELNDIIQKM